jgi:hypothetical protein
MCEKNLERHNCGQQFVSLCARNWLIFCWEPVMYTKKARSSHFELSAKRIRCGDWGLSYSFPKDQVQLREISGQFNGFFLSKKNY